MHPSMVRFYYKNQAYVAGLRDRNCVPLSTQEGAYFSQVVDEMFCLRTTLVCGMVALSSNMETTYRDDGQRMKKTDTPTVDSTQKSWSKQEYGKVVPPAHFLTLYI